MTKLIKTKSSRRRWYRSLHKSTNIIENKKGAIHIQASFNNTIITLTDICGKVIYWSSAGTCGLKSARRKTPLAAKIATENIIRAVKNKGLQRIEVMIKGTGNGRNAAIQVIRKSGLFLSIIRDVTPIPHNGCRPPKKRRL
uniref:Small ribosomal subunit protein uS11c n=1 Tax=Cytinus hypocistis TaxID=327100 RepID=A0A1B0V5T6_9ROSI|nr:ribosomal protein S11 [Cytinus hypocistis]AMR36139.1 ribosomal protein S11 [Cytinus hypocistis]